MFLYLRSSVSQHFLNCSEKSHPDVVTPTPSQSRTSNNIFSQKCRLFPLHAQLTRKKWRTIVINFNARLSLINVMVGPIFPCLFLDSGPIENKKNSPLPKWKRLGYRISVIWPQVRNHTPNQRIIFSYHLGIQLSVQMIRQNFLCSTASIFLYFNVTSLYT